jgi:hypothetical protein
MMDIEELIGEVTEIMDMAVDSNNNIFSYWGGLTILGTPWHQPVVIVESNVDSNFPYPTPIASCSTYAIPKDVFTMQCRITWANSMGVATKREVSPSSRHFLCWDTAETNNDQQPEPVAL